MTLRAAGLLRMFENAGVLAPADVHVAYRLARLAGETNEPVLLATALTVRALRLGSVCVELDRLRDVAADIDAAVDRTNDGAHDGPSVAGKGPAAPEELPWPDPDALLAALQRSPLVVGGPAGPLKPLILIETTGGWLLYLNRYHRQEQTIRNVLEARGQSRPLVDLAVIADRLAALFRDGDDPRRASPAPDRQRVAAALAATEWTTIVAGGPGTGKTHTVARVLALLYTLHGPSLRVALAAPTGKAAVRLQEAVAAQADELGLPGDLAATTLHRLLSWRRGSSTRFAHHARNRLPYDVIVLDETSMVSLTMMSRLADALRPDTRLVLIGDPDQLMSVDAGAVLADLVARPANRTANPDLAELVTSDLTATSVDGEPPMAEEERDRLRGAIVRLRRGRRFAGAIADLADAVRRGTDDDVIDILNASRDGVSFHGPGDLATVRIDVSNAGVALIDAAKRDDVPAALAALGAHRLLCAHRQGPYGVRRWSRIALDWTSAACGQQLDSGPWYPGQPLLVTANDYEAGLYNGDIGVIIEAPDGLVAAFDRGAEPLLIHPGRLTAVQTVYAMTIHRSQGSQYDTVSVILPGADSALLTRQLLYTAITRARRHVRIVGSEATVRAGTGRQVRRASGIARGAVAP